MIGNYAKYLRPIVTKEDAEFWAMVRASTSSEHSLNFNAPNEVREYCEIREAIRESMLSKLMYTENTLAIMTSQNKHELCKTARDKHLNARDVFIKERNKVLAHPSVVELPHNCVDFASAADFVAGLAPHQVIVYVTQKEYNGSGQSNAVGLVKRAAYKLGKTVYMLGCQYTKQKKEMSHEMYYSSTIVAVFQRVLLEYGPYGFDYDPGSFPMFLNDSGCPIYTMSRRMDGAYPSSIDPVVLWETKEYYDNKSYGSRVNDSIYETMLSGGEIANLNRVLGRMVNHYLFVDGYYCFGNMGKALLLRYVDAFFQGFVDDVFIGSDVITHWEHVARAIIGRRPVQNGLALLG